MRSVFFSLMLVLVTALPQSLSGNEPAISDSVLRRLQGWTSAWARDDADPNGKGDGWKVNKQLGQPVTASRPQGDHNGPRFRRDVLEAGKPPALGSEENEKRVDRINVDKMIDNKNSSRASAGLCHGKYRNGTESDSCNEGDWQVHSYADAGALAQLPSQNNFQALVINLHNGVRDMHGRVPHLTWSNQLAIEARKWALQCNYAHGPRNSKGGLDYGQNIAFQSKYMVDSKGNHHPPTDEMLQSLRNPLIQMATAWGGWYSNERGLYDYSTGQLRAGEVQKWIAAGSPAGKEPQVGHFTQIVWKATTQVGCSVELCRPLRTSGMSELAAAYTVCNYSPAGNVIRSEPGRKYELYLQNVKPPR